MKKISLRISTLVIYCLFSISATGNSQNSTVKVNQDEKIKELLNVKKEINKNNEDSNRYKIQIFNGNRIGSKEAKRDFDYAFPEWESTDIYEPPNFKVWVGSYRSRLEADRALRKIKTKFNSAFIFKPKKEKI